MSKSIKDVRAMYGDELMAIKGVRSVGIGLDGDGNQAIIVGVEGVASQAGSPIPRSLEGFPVVVQTVGNIKAD